ncbi:MAG: VapE domain-containing protein [Alphaproteobacteria bacterium]
MNATAQRKQPARGFQLPDVLAPLTALPNWVVWRWVIRKNKKGEEVKTKPLFQSRNPRAFAKSTDPSTWSDYDTARDALEASRADGIGFCLLGTDFAAFDLDDCRDRSTGAIAPWAQALVDRVRSYSEVTVSGTGLRIIGRASGPKVHRKQSVEEGGTLETYRRAERYIVMTGRMLPNTPKELAEIDRHIDEIVLELDGKGTARATKAKDDANVEHNAEGHETETDKGDIDDIIRNGRYELYGGDRSAALWRVINGMLRRGDLPEKIEAAILDDTNKISEHVREHGSNAAAVAKQQVAKAIKKLEFSKGDKGPHATPANIRIALLKLGVRVRKDEFADRMLIDGLDTFGPVLSDAAMDRLWIEIGDRFHFRPGHDLFATVLQDTAERNKFHPVQEYLGSLKWDGKERIDKWLSTYGGATDNEYTQAVGAITLVAAVRRVRSPGCKFDEMLVLESPDQGTDKSSALAILAVQEDWFSDDLPLNMEGKRVIEALQGHWIVEAGELAGMKRADIEHLKAFQSRRVDRARMSYDRLKSVVRRQCVTIGTTNKETYLRDTTGNRRYWPVRVTRFDLKALARDRDQLWAEAAAREAAGESIRLKPELWPLAAAEQDKRLTQDPWFDTLSSALGDRKGKISSELLWEILEVGKANQSQEQSNRLNEAMAKLGWVRPDNRLVNIDHRRVVGFTKGSKPWRAIKKDDLSM